MLYIKERNTYRVLYLEEYKTRGYEHKKGAYR